MLPVIELEIKTKDMEKGVSELDRGTINLFLFSLGLFFLCLYYYFVLFLIKCLFVKFTSMCGLPFIMLLHLEPGGCNNLNIK